LDFDEKCQFLYFSTIMITGLGFGLEDTGLGLVLGLEENWPWPQRLLALASNMLSSNPSLPKSEVVFSFGLRKKLSDSLRPNFV